MSLDCRLINACVACYAIEEASLPADNPNFIALRPKAGTKPLVFANGTDKINAGFVAETEDGYAVLAIRGTLPPKWEGNWGPWIRDWWQDFQIGPVDWTVNGAAFGRVEGGFKTAMLSVWDQITALLDRIDVTSKRAVLVTGHSKGAAMTVLAASLLQARYNVPIEVRAFAMPMVADHDFKAKYDALGLSAHTVRYQNQFDIVPFLPDWPTMAKLATEERRHGDAKRAELGSLAWPHWEYVEIGALKGLVLDCLVWEGWEARDYLEGAIAWALERAYENHEFARIAEAHSAAGRYLQCTCGQAAGVSRFEAANRERVETPSR